MYSVRGFRTSFLLGMKLSSPLSLCSILALAISPNLVNQDFMADRADQLWASDIAYIQALKGTLYLAVILDVFSRKIVGWSMQQRMKDSLAIDAFNSTWNSRRPDKGLLFHSDRGSQYCSGSFIRVLRNRECLQSMSSTGNCYDNAITETFFKTLRAELTYHVSFKDRDDARKEIFSYIELFYCGIRFALVDAIYGHEHSEGNGTYPANVSALNTRCRLPL